MRCGLFGKVSSKRDFIAFATPRKFLEVWETWLQACLSASRHQLGSNWQTAFLTAPIWRFWLGADVCGTSVAGAIMPSMDAMGRYYPLTLHAISDDGTSIVPPDADSQDDWYADVENVLLKTLEAGMSFEDTVQALDQLRPPRVHSESGAHFIQSGNLVGVSTIGDDFVSSLSLLRSINPGLYAAGTFWWTAGGANFTSMALTNRGMLDPYAFSGLLTGKAPPTTTSDGEFSKADFGASYS